MAAASVTEVDPFELPDWLGSTEVTWTAATSVTGQGHVPGRLSGAGDALTCDLLAADEAYPEAVLDQEWRRAAHQQWTHGQVLIVECDGRLTLAVPGTGFTADRVLECLSRLARAVGAKPTRFVAALRL